MIYVSSPVDNVILIVDAICKEDAERQIKLVFDEMGKSAKYIIKEIERDVTLAMVGGELWQR